MTSSSLAFLQITFLRFFLYFVNHACNCDCVDIFHSTVFGCLLSFQTPGAVQTSHFYFSWSSKALLCPLLMAFEAPALAILLYIYKV